MPMAERRLLEGDESIREEEEEEEEGNADGSRLKQLGYKQELSRSLSVISSFSVSFSVISVLTGITTLYNTGLEFGGPVTMIYGWPIAGAFTLMVGLAMSEICSAYPTSGGLYFWSAKLCGNRWGPFASWITGWFNIVGQTEETKNADKNGPKGIISSIGISIIVGWGYLLGITFAATNIPYLLSSDNDAGGYAIAEVFYLAFKSRYGNGIGGIICLGIVAVAIFFCGMSSVTSNSRTVYAFSRDGAMPLSSFWHKVNDQEVPINAVWLSAFISFCMALTSLGSLVAFQAMVSIATIGLYIAYALPIFFRVTLARKSFVPGPFNLGRYSLLVGRVAVLWVATITVLFSLPVAYPITGDTLNYTPVLVGGLLLLTVASWLLSARHWFRGPTTNINARAESSDT
ncbi:hypothetical protein C4D60_Mb01t25920 [Musa balbisiana]|uniref:Amino acid permease/ SLC12A domain-containing protein n=1 Tax=Musa balbisiana TaxID=52838 RepID=A0A4S8JQF9_MUSBA|nr:hypothetical protein C4D60_Mb01t25920 [Musa balbisiana]